MRRSDDIEPPFQVLSVTPRDFTSQDVGFLALQGEPDRLRDGPRAFHPLWVVVRDLRDSIAPRERFFERLPPVEVRDRGHPHGGAIPEAPVRSGHRACHPPAKRPPPYPRSG